MRLSVVRAVRGERVDAGHGEHRTDAERGRGGIPHLDAGDVDRLRQALAAPVGGRGKTVPAGRGPGGVGLLPAGRHGDLAVLERRAVRIADPVERRDLLAGEAAGFFEHRVDEAVVEIAVESLGVRRVKARGVAERECNFGDGRAIHGSGLRHATVAIARGVGKAGQGCAQPAGRPIGLVAQAHSI